MLLVIKIGGDLLFKKYLLPIIEDLKFCRERRNLDVIFVHGGGDIVTAVANKFGIEQKFVVSPSGFKSRYTDDKAIEIYTMVMAGKINKELVSFLQKNGLSAIGLSGIDGSLLIAERKKRIIVVDERGRRRIINGGYTGRIIKVNTELLSKLLLDKYIPVISPVAIGTECEVLNVDGDRAASNIAGYMKADKLLFLTDVEGVYLDDKLIREMTLEEAETNLRKIKAGMITKLYASIEALKLGANRVVISSGKAKNPITSALEERGGTVIHG